MKDFCTAMAGIVAAIVVGSISTTVPAHADTLSDQALDAHKSARAQYGAGPLTWNDDLAPGAIKHAQKCQFKPSDSQGQYGENLYVSTESNAGIQDAVTSWMAESSKYDYNSPGFSRSTGRFTQVVWKATTQVAVAIVSCRAGTIFPMASTFVVARYTPPGNVAGQFPQNVGRPTP